MKKLLTLLVLIVCINPAHSQYYDLVVKTNGDSIACRIDSITDSQIFFKMKSRERWIHTDIDRDVVVDYKYNAIDKKIAIFKPGSSYIESFRKVPTSLRDVRRNSVAFETNIFTNSLYYGRIFVLGENIGITAGVGLNDFAGEVQYITLESTMLSGTNKKLF